MMEMKFCLGCGEPLGELVPGGVCPCCTMRAMAERGGLFGRDGNDEVGPDVPGLTVHEQVGEGGFGMVYRATEISEIKRAVALKVLKPGLDTRQILRRFELERKALALLEHPNIARFYSAGETPDGYPYFTMEYIQGEPVSEAYAGKDLEIVLEGFILICGAIDYAHRKGVVHRDLKPSNLLVTSEGQVKVIDFGVAKALDPNGTPGLTLYTADERSVGTPSYMSPEQLTGEEVDERSDVYALGAVLYQVLTGIAPLEAATGKMITFPQAQSAIDEVIIPSASSVALRPLPWELDQVLKRALMRNRDQRFQSAAAFGVGIRRFLNGEAPPVRRDGLSGKLVWIIGGLVVAVAVALFFVLSTKAPSEEATTKIEMISMQSSGHPSTIEVSPDGKRALGIFRVNGDTFLFNPKTGEKIKTIESQPRGIGTGTFSADGSRFAIGFSDGSFRWYESINGKPVSKYLDCIPRRQGWVPNMCHVTQPEPLLLTVTTDAYARAWRDDGSLRWECRLVAPPYRLGVSPDQKLALTGTIDGRINVIEVETGKKSVWKAHQDKIYDIEFAHDGSRLAIASYDGLASIWSPDGVRLHDLQHQGRCHAVTFSPDRQFLASASFDGFARIWEVETGKLLFKLPHESDVLSVAFSPDGTELISGGRDNFVRWWSVESGEEIKAPTPCAGAVEELVYTSNAVLIMTWDNVLQVLPF